MTKSTVPAKGKSTGRKPIYNFNLMEVGECKIIKEKDSKKAVQSAYAYGKRTGKRFVQRNGGVEVWREK